MTRPHPRSRALVPSPLAGDRGRRVDGFYSGVKRRRSASQNSSCSLSPPVAQGQGQVLAPHGSCAPSRRLSGTVTAGPHGSCHRDNHSSQVVQKTVGPRRPEWLVPWEPGPGGRRPRLVCPLSRQVRQGRGHQGWLCSGPCGLSSLSARSLMLSSPYPEHSRPHTGHHLQSLLGLPVGDHTH